MVLQGPTGEECLHNGIRAAVVFDLAVSLNSTLLSSCVGVLLFTGIIVDDGLILDLGTFSLSSGH